MIKRLLIGITGASGAPIALALLQALAQTQVRAHVMVTPGGELTLRQECGLEVKDLEPYAETIYDIHSIGAEPASGSAIFLGMVVVPCTMKTVAGIHSGYSDNLLLRAADVTLKEGRKLVLVARESPMSAIHLRNLYELSRLGVVILPPMLSYYGQPRSVADLTDQVVGKILDQFRIEHAAYRRWKGMDR